MRSLFKTMKGTLLTLAAVAVLGCASAGKPSGTVHDKETTVTLPAPSSDPFEGVFPPAWHVGDRWRVSMSSVFRHAGEQDVRTLVYDFLVEEAPEGDEGVFLVRIKSATLPRVNWLGKYRKRPFSFVGLEDPGGNPVPPSSHDNGEGPFVGTTWEGFLKDFPIMPAVPRLGVTPLTSKKPELTQEIARTPEGLRFTLVDGPLRSVIEWKRGAPWWSSLEWTDPHRLGEPPYPSAKLLPSGT